jgi:hypothetical protein
MKRYFPAAALVFFALSSVTRAYVFENLIWGVPSTTIYVDLNATQGQLGTRTPRFPLEDGSASFDQVFFGAVATWNYYLGNLKIQPADGGDPKGFNPNDNISEANFGNAAEGDTLGNEILAVTEIYYYVGTNSFASSGIVFNSNASSGINWNSYRGPLQGSTIDLRRVALHELGHFIGLDHPDQHGQNVNAIMNSVVSNTDNLTYDDAAGAGTLYLPSLARVTQVSSLGDFSGNGNSDLLWRNVTTGDVGVWLMSGSSVVSSAVVRNAPMTWRIIGLADMNHDGKTDILWYDTVGGEYGVWYMNGTSLLTAQTFKLPASYPVVLFGDLTNSGNVDAVEWSPSTGALLICQNQGGLNFAEAYYTVISPDWVLVGLADINGDGHKKLIWRSQSTGAVGAWYLNGFQFATSAVFGTVPLSWSLRGIGRFNGNNIDDFVWHNIQTGQVAIWNFNSAGQFSASYSETASSSWDIFATQKAGSTNARIFWYNLSSYQTAIWSLTGSTVSGATVLGNNPPVWLPEPLGY